VEEVEVEEDRADRKDAVRETVNTDYQAPPPVAEEEEEGAEETQPMKGAATLVR
jgi:hypothetical protein